MLFAKNIAIAILSVMLLSSIGRQELRADAPKSEQPISLSISRSTFDVCSGVRTLTFAVMVEEAIFERDSIFAYEVLFKFDPEKFVFNTVQGNNTMSEAMGQFLSHSLLAPDVLRISGGFQNASVLNSERTNVLFAFSLRTREQCADTTSIEILRHTWRFQRNGRWSTNDPEMSITDNRFLRLEGIVTDLPERAIRFSWSGDSITLDSSDRAAHITLWSGDNTLPRLQVVESLLTLPEFVSLDSIHSLDNRFDFQLEQSEREEDNSYFVKVNVREHGWSSGAEIARLFISAVDDDTAYRTGSIVIEPLIPDPCSCVGRVVGSTLFVNDTGVPKPDTSDYTSVGEVTKETKDIVVRVIGESIIVQMNGKSNFGTTKVRVYDLFGKVVTEEEGNREMYNIPLLRSIAGVYFVEVQTAHKKIIEKVLFVP